MSIKKIIIALLGIIMISSCNKILDREPQSELDGSTRFKDINDYDYALLGAYSLFRSRDYYSSFDGNSNAFVGLPDILSDNMNETDESLGNERVFSRWQYAEDEAQIENTWLIAYRIISQCNLVLKDIDKLSATNEGAVNRIKGQALAIRAMVHFDLLRYWADEYIRNSTKPGVPYITVYDYEQKPARGTIKETYDNIEQDLTQALALLPNSDVVINDGERSYIDEYVVNAILARESLYSGQYDKAVQYATAVIDQFPLADINVFPSIWTDASLDEVIWSFSFDAGQGQVGGNLYAPDVNRSQYQPNLDLVAQYDPNNDVRFFSYFGEIEDNYGDMRIVLTKYLAKFSQIKHPDGVTNFKAFRTGEMYLVRAEANARLGGAFEAYGLADLNDLRAARIFGYTPVVLTGAGLLNAIALERRKELIAEGHRFFDLKRTTRALTRSNCTSFCTLTPTSRAWTWPIPRPEIDANPNILPQNPGY
jgi:starch-binding outer membrane protein, SusD/RagB family